MPNVFQIKEEKWSLANTGGPTENSAMIKSHAFRYRFLSELRSKIKYLMNALKIYFIICSIHICSGLRTSIRKVLSVTFFYDYSYYRGLCFKNISILVLDFSFSLQTI